MEDPTTKTDASRGTAAGTTMAAETRLRVGVIEAKGGETAVWNVGDKKVSIWFPKEGVFPEQVIVKGERGDKNGEIRVEIPTSPLTTTGEPRTYQYCMYCHDDDEFVEWHSHPIMVIPKP